MAHYMAKLLLAGAAVPAWVLVRWLFWGLRGRGGPAAREILLGLFAWYGLWLLLLVWESGPYPHGAFPAAAWTRLRTGQGVNFVPFVTIRRLLYGGWNGTATANLVGNVVLFSPVGFCLPLLWWRWQKLWRVFLFAAGAPLCIEALQLSIGRSVDIDDVLLNCIGILLGYCLWRLIAKKSSKVWRLAA